MNKKLVVLICYILLENAKHARPFELECENEGYSVVESGSCEIYYFCVKSANNVFFPVIFECPQGEEFSLLKNQCVPEDNNECGELPEIAIDGPLLLDDFVCPSSGRFPNVKSPDCKSYYVCSSALIPVLTNCPSTSIFSWVSMKCVVPTAFTCPNEITTSSEATTTETHETPTPDGFTCITEGHFSDPESDDCKSYYVCEAKTDGIIDAILSRCPLTTVFNPENQKCVELNQYECSTIITSTASPTTQAATTLETMEPNTFKCIDVGRFPDPASTDCTTYYVCTIDVNEAYEAIQNQCPLSTIFSPVDQRCLESGYQCPTDTSAKTNEPSTIESTSSYTTDFEVTTQDYLTKETTDTGNLPTENTSEQIILTSSNPESFICTSNGRFSNPESMDCKSYYLCVENMEGVFEATLKQCPSVSIFHAESGKCVLPTTYKCPTDESATINPTEKPSTIVTTTSSTETSTLTTPSTTMSSTDSTISLTGIITTTNEPSASETYEPTPGESFACTENGRFPDPESSDCKSYYLCTETTEGFFKTTLNQCPAITIFNPENGKCVLPSFYDCYKEETINPKPTAEPSTVTTPVSSSETSNITTAEPSTPVITTKGPPSSESFICTAVGRFPDPMSTNCNSYYLCSTTLAGDFNAILTQCPSGTIFSAELNRCVLMSQYQCPTATTTSTVGPITVETTTATTSLTTPISGNFICSSIGLHPDTSQLDCSRYKYCLLTATNTFLEFTFNCPMGSYFNPQELRCSNDYNCPNVSPSVTPESTTELTLMTTLFYCTADGRFPDPTSEDCNTYIMCIKTAVGNFQYYNFKCPKGSLFSPTESKCSSSYTCA